MANNRIDTMFKQQFEIMPEAEVCIDEVLPEEGFLWDFYNYCRKSTDACSFFILFGGLMAISAVVAKQVSLNIGETPLRPALWALLLGESTRSRKSTVIKITKNLVYKVHKESVLPMEFSKEKLLEILSDRQAGTFFWSEGSNQLQYFKSKYMLGTTELLTDLHDGGFYDRSLKSKDEPLVLQNCPISIFAGSQKNWWLETIDETAVRGGFFPRFLLILSTERGKPIPIPPQKDRIEERKLIDQLTAIAQISGEVDISQVKQKYIDWWIAHEEECEKTSMYDSNTKPIIDAFYGRLAEYCWKLAILYQLSINRSLIITPDTMQGAITLVEFLKGNLRRMYLQGDFTLNKDLRKKINILREIRVNPGISHSTLLRKFNMLKKYFTPLIETLLEENEIQKEYESTGTKKKLVYYANNGDGDE